MDDIESQNFYHSYEDDIEFNSNESKYFYYKILTVSFVITLILIVLFMLF